MKVKKGLIITWLPLPLFLSRATIPNAAIAAVTTINTITNITTVITITTRSISDVALTQFLINLDNTKDKKFILAKLDATHLFIT